MRADGERLRTCKAARAHWANTARARAHRRRASRRITVALSHIDVRRITREPGNETGARAFVIK